jgi:serine/threonine protein kinase
MEPYPGSKLKVVDSCLNCLILTELVGLQKFNLRDLINPDILEIVIQQVMSQLKWLHRGGCFHLDVKASNLLPDENNLDAFHSLQDKYGERKAVSLIMQLVDNLNTTLVCE